MELHANDHTPPKAVTSLPILPDSCTKQLESTCMTHLHLQHHICHGHCQADKEGCCPGS